MISKENYEQVTLLNLVKLRVRMRVRIGKALLYGAGLSAGGAGLYSFHKGGYDPDNVGKQTFA